MPEQPQAPTGGGPDTSQAPPGGDQADPGAVQSGLGPDQNRIPPAGGPGAQSVAPAGLLVLGRMYMAMAHGMIYKAIKSFPPGKELHSAMKLYQHMAKDFELPPVDQDKQGQQAGPPGAQGPQMPQPGMGGPPQMGPPPGGLPRGPAPGSTPLPAAA